MQATKMTDLGPTHQDARDAERGGLSRRQLVTSVAWATPVILLATAAPATAASGDIRVTIDAIVGDGNGSERDQPGLFPWIITVTATNHSSVSVPVTITILPSAGTLQQPDTVIQVMPAGATQDFRGFGELVSTSAKTETLTAIVADPPDQGAGGRMSVPMRRGSPIPYTGTEE